MGLWTAGMGCTDAGIKTQPQLMCCAHAARTSDRTGICLGTDMVVFAYYFSINNSFAPYFGVQLVT